MPDRLHKTALHESGHALLYLLHYIPIHEWSIVEEAATEGFVIAEHEPVGLHQLTNAHAGIAASGSRRPWNQKDFLHSLPVGIGDDKTDSEVAARIIFNRMKMAGFDDIRKHEHLLELLMQESLKKVRCLFKRQPFPQTIASLADYMMERHQERRANINKQMLAHLRTNNIGRLEKERMVFLLNNTNYQDLLSRENILTLSKKI